MNEPEDFFVFHPGIHNWFPPKRDAMRNIKDCKVAVVGGAGFLGSHCVDELVNRGCKVLAIDNLVAGKLEFVNKAAEFVHHDITGSEDYLRGIFHNFGAKYVLNYAAHPYVPDSYSRPGRVCDVNFMGAIKVINAAQEAGCKGILQVSSAELYGERKWDGDPAEAKITEDSPVIPHSSYGASKAAVDAYCQVAWKERNTSVIALRQFNCVGERDETHPYVIPEVIKQLAGKDPAGWGTTPAVIYLGNNSFRDFLYAKDQAKIAVELLEKGEFGEVYNLGSETGIKIYDLAKLIGKLMGFEEVVVQQDPARVRPWEIWHLLSDNAKIFKVLSCGYPEEDIKATYKEALTPLEEALRLTIDYFKNNGWRFSW